ncbi:prepilin-type N-terminal cleavage/methylation domain-containing protein [Candidatus Saccharibacteria bacterium]|nr:prepilin-type N-terminal cleavage/methylation domain-containing protein [Candidatus Saccharibacteria bacterium]
MKTNNNGFTILELLIAVSISSLLFIGIMNFLAISIRDNSIRQAKIDLLREAQLTLDTISKDVKLSSNVLSMNSIADPYSPSSAIEGMGWESSDDTLIIAKAVEDLDGNIQFEDPNRYITAKNNIIFFVQDNNLYKRTIANQVANNRVATTCPESANSSTCPKDVKLAEGIDGFELKYFDGMNNEVLPEQARSVEATLELSKTKYNHNISAEYTTRMVFRNE